MALSSLSAYNNLFPSPATGQTFKTSASHFQASFEKTLIDITTSDGDIVSLQRSSSHAALSQSSQWQTSSSQGLAFHSQLVDSHSFSYTIQGDLSAEELEDLGALFDDLSLIADDFFQGHLEEAMAGALNLGDMGSLSSLSASFTKTEIVASQLSTSHPYAQAENSRAINDENALARQRQAQWQQILAYLDKRQQDLPKPAQPDKSAIKDHSEEMRARITEIMEKHQRLAPLIDKLADQAIKDQQQHHESQGHEPQTAAPSARA